MTVSWAWIGWFTWLEHYIVSPFIGVVFFCRYFSNGNLEMKDNITDLGTGWDEMSPKAMVLNHGPPDVIELQPPEAFATTSAGQDFWELKSKNIWRPKVGDHCPKGYRVGQPQFSCPFFRYSISWWPSTYPSFERQCCPPSSMCLLLIRSKCV